MTDTTTHDLLLTQRVKDRLRYIFDHIDRMENERQGYGPEPMADVHSTRASLLSALSVLLAADEVWVDGQEYTMSFGGRMPGGIVFGMIARLTEASDDEPWFSHYRVDWTFHS